jgi:hypothetical protein
LNFAAVRRLGAVLPQQPTAKSRAKLVIRACVVGLVLFVRAPRAEGRVVRTL